MPIPRPILLALVGAVLVGGAFFASRGLTGTSEESSAPVTPAPQQEAPAPSKPKAATSARQALKGAPVVRSGEFDLRVTAKRLELRAQGSFQSQGLSEMPRFEVELTGESGGRSLQAGAVSMGETGFLLRGDEALVVEPQGWNALTQARAEEGGKGPGGEPFNGYNRKELSSFKFQGSDTLDGAPVLHFRGAVDPKEARDDYSDIGEVFEMTSLESPVPSTLERSIRGGTINFWVGAEDRIIRREVYSYDTASGPVEIDYRRAEVNEPQTISAPADAIDKTPLQAGWDRQTFGLAFTALAVGVLAIEPGGGRSGDRQEPVREPAPKDRGEARKGRGEGRNDRGAGRSDRGAGRTDRGSRRAERHAPRRSRTTPMEVRRAIARNAVVILFFRQRGADDDAVANAVTSVRGRKGVAVFMLPVGQAPKYGKFGGASVVRAPTVVLIGRDDKPRIFEGFIDSTTLAQAVADAR